MPALTPTFVWDLESNMKVITAGEFQRLTKNTWWNRVAKLMNSSSAKERLHWLLDSAKIRQTDVEGDVTFDDLLMQSHEYENKHATAGLELKRSQFEDVDGNGVKLAADWSRMIGSQAAYWPQKLVARAMKENPVGYDGVTFFHTAHPVNPFMPSYGTFANRFTGAASGIYPGAAPIDESVDLETALANLVKVIAYIASIPMANGEDPRMLRPVAILHPPALTARVQQLTKAKFIAMAAASGAGSADVEPIVRAYGFGEPIEAPELSSAFVNGSDTSYYLLTAEMGSDELGAFTYLNREAFNVLYHGPVTDHELARMNELQWMTRGRNVVGAGHPYLMFRADKT